MKNQAAHCTAAFLMQFIFSVLFPVSAFAQKDQPFPDSNDKLEVPFEITTIRDGEFAGDTHWYSIRVSSGKMWHTREDSEGVFCTSATVTAADDAYLWCFTGDNVSGYRIYNKAKGARHIAYAASAVTHEPLVMAALPETRIPRTLKVSRNRDGYNFYYPGNSTLCVNDLHGDGVLTLWENAQAATDDGCRMTFTLVSGDGETPSSEGLPFKPTKLLEDGTLASNTHWYSMSIRGGKNIYADKERLLCQEMKDITEEQLWAFVGNAEGGFEIYNYSQGTAKRAYTARGSSGSPVEMEDKVTSSGTYKWKISSNPNGGYNLYYPGFVTSCWNDYNLGNEICIWRAAGAPNDEGSCIVFTEQNLNNVGEVVLLTAIKPDPSSYSLFPGEKTKIKCTFEPADASSTALWFVSQDEAVCTVNGNSGEITAVAPGETNIIIYSMDGSGCYAFCKVIVKDGSSLMPVEGPVFYVYRTDGGVDAFPEAYLSSMEEADGLQITGKDGTSYRYKANEYERVGEDAPTDFAHFTSFKFNNKYNRDLTEDAFGMIVNDSLISLTASCIGKWLAPSFELDDATDAVVYVGGTEQKTRITRNSFKEDVLYTVTRPGYNMLRVSADGAYSMVPFGRDYRVQVDFLTDHPTGEYNVPTIYVTTDDGRPISSKVVYKTGTVRIDGAGVFPGLEETPIQIKGRGNSSWSGSTYAKNPYHMKFDEKTSVLGLRKGKHWNLIANAQHMSMMTNAIGMKVARLVGTQASNHEIPVELYLNGEYRGSYNLTEKVGFGNNSLDVSDALVNAALLELDTYFDERNKFRTAATYYYLPVNIKEPESFTEPYMQMNINNVKRRFITGFLASLKQGTGIEAHVDVQSLATYLMTNELICNYELFHPKSTYCFCRDILNEDSLIHFGPVWDLDWGFGYEASQSYFQTNPREDYWTRWMNSSNMEGRAFMYDLRFKSGEAFEREYFRVWTDFVQNHLDELLDFCDEYQTYAQPSFDHNGERWYEGSYYASQVQEAKKWLKERANYVYDHLTNDLGYAEKYPEVVDDPTPVIEIAEDSAVRKPEDNRIYTLDGVPVENKGRLRRGIYIIRGRKVVVH